MELIKVLRFVLMPGVETPGCGRVTPFGVWVFVISYVDYFVIRAIVLSCLRRGPHPGPLPKEKTSPVCGLD